MTSATKDIHDIIEKPTTVKVPVTFKIKKSRETARLFTGSFRSVLIVTAYDYFRVTRVRCLSKNSSYVYLPLDYPEKIIFTNIENRRCCLSSQNRFKSSSKKIWLTVARKFPYNKVTYDVGDILGVKKSSLWKRLTKWIRHDVRQSNNESSSSGGADVQVFVYPSKKHTKIPVQLLETHCRLCDPPGEVTGKSKYLSVAMEEETLPFLLTIPFDPFKRTITSPDSAPNPTSTAAAPYFENVFVEGTDTFDVFIVSNTNNNRLTALVVPEDVLFHVEELPTQTTATTATTKQITDNELLAMKHDVTPQIVNTENIEEATEITLRKLEKNLNKKVDNSCETLNQIEYFCVKDNSSNTKRKESLKSSRTEENFLSPLQYSFESSFREPSSDGTTSESELSEEEQYSGKLPTKECGKKGVSKKRKRNEYLLPLNQYTIDYSFFKHGENKNHNNKSKSNNNNDADECFDDQEATGLMSGNVVIGPDGYVKVQIEKNKRSKEYREKPLQKLTTKPGEGPVKQVGEGFNINRETSLTPKLLIPCPRNLTTRRTSDVRQQQQQQQQQQSSAEKVLLIYNQQKFDCKNLSKSSVINLRQNSNSEQSLLLSSSTTDKDVVWNNDHKTFDSQSANRREHEFTTSKDTKLVTNYSNSLRMPVTSPKKSTKSPRNFMRKLVTAQQMRPISQSFTPLLSSQLSLDNEATDHAAGNNFYYCNKTPITKNNSLKSRITFFEHNTPPIK